MASRAMRRNVILAVSVASALGLAGVAFVLYEGRTSRQVEALLEGARHSMQVGHIDEAKVQLYQVLELAEPDPIEARAMLGRICFEQFEQTGRTTYAHEAIDHLAAASRQAPRQRKLLDDLARACMALVERTPDANALRQLGEVAGRLRTIDPESPDARFFEARSLIMPGFPRRVEAEELVDKALVGYALQDPPSERMLDAYRLKLSLIKDRHAQQETTRRRELEQRLRQPKLSEADKTRIRDYYDSELRALARQAGDEMLKVIEGALKVFPNAISMNVAKAGIYEQRPDGSEQAERIMNSLIERLPDTGRDTSDAWLAVATFYSRRGGAWADKALAAYDTSVAADPTNPRPRHVLAQRYFEDGQYDKALAQCDVLIELNDADARARLLRADILFKREDYRKTMVELDAVIADTTAGQLYKIQAKLTKALVLLREEQPAESLKMLNELVHVLHKPEADDKVPQVLLRQLAKLRIDTYLALGDVASARQIVDQSGIENTGASIQVLLKTDPAEALETIDRLLPRNQGFNKLTLLLLKYRAHLATGAFDEAGKVLDHAEAVLAGELSESERTEALAADVRLKRLDLLVASRQFDKAEAYLSKIEGLPGAEQRLLLARVQVLHGKGQSEKACALARQLIHERPQDSDAAFLGAAVFWAAGQPATAETLMEELTRRKPGDADVLVRRAEFYIRQARAVQEADGREALYRKALADYRSAYQLKPQMAALPERVVALLKELGREDQIDAMLEQITRSQPEMQLQNLLLACRVYFSRGQLEAARLKAQQALALDARFAQTHVLLGDIAFRGNRPEQAVKHFREAISCNPRVTLTRLKLAEALLALNRYDQAVKAADSYLEAEPGHAGALRLKAEALTRDRREREALAVHDRIVELTGLSPTALKDKAVLLSRLGARQGDESMQNEASDLFEQAIQRADTPEVRYDIRFARAQHLLTTNRVDYAENALVELTAENPGNMAAWLALGRISLGRDNPAAARDWFEKAVDHADDKAEAYVRVAGFYAENSPPDWVAARAYADKALALDADRLGALLLRFRSLVAMPAATLATRTSLVEQAAETLRQIEKAAGAPQWYRRGQLRLAEVDLQTDPDAAAKRRRKLDEAIDALEKSVVDNPHSDEPVLLLARSCGLAGQAEKAVSVLDAFLQKQPDNRAVRMTKVRLNLSQGRLGEAIVDLDALRKAYPVDAEVNRLLAQTHLAAHDPAAAQAVLKDMTAAYPDNPSWTMDLAAATFRRGQVDTARRLYEEVLAATDGTHLGAFEGLVRCHMQDGQPVGLVARLRRAWQRTPDPRLQLLIFQLLADRHDGAPSPARFEEAVSAARQALKEQPRLEVLWAHLASFHYRNGKPKEALELASEGIEAMKAAGAVSVLLVYDKSVMLARADRRREAIALSTDLLRRRELPPALQLRLVNNLAYWHASEGTPEDIRKAREFVDKVLLKTPSPDAGMLDTIGYVHLKSGDAPQALEAFQQAIRLNRTMHRRSVEAKKTEPMAEVVDIRPSIQYHLGLAYLALDKTSEARRAFETALTLHRDSPPALQLTPSELQELRRSLTP